MKELYKLIDNYVTQKYSGSHSVQMSEFILKALIKQIPEIVQYTDEQRHEDLKYISTNLSKVYNIDDILRVIIDNMDKDIWNFEKSYDYRFYYTREFK